MHSSNWMFLGSALVMAGASSWGCRRVNTTQGGAGGATASANTVSVVAAGPTTNSSSSGMPGSSKLGAACGSDGDCDAGMRCITSAEDDPVLGGGAVNGYCTKNCLKSSDCPGMGNACMIPMGASKGECFRACDLGPELKYIDDGLDAGKCLGREDTRCTALKDATVCLPTCGLDSQCGGRVCDPATGTCKDKAHTGKPNGAVCNPKAATNECSGFCQTFSGTPAPASICSQACVLGGELETSSDCGGIEKGLCVFRPSMHGAGDFGRCSAACSKHDNCGNPDWWCQGNSWNPNPNGYCFSSPACKTAADCAEQNKNLTVKAYDCVTTKYGGRCLEKDPDCVKMNNGDVTKCMLRYPLGSAAPMGSGAGGAGGGGGNGGSGGK